jgi:hypothetical protein
MKFALVALAVTSALALFAAACSDDDNKTASGSSTASQASVDDLAATVQQNAEMFALITIGAIPLHDMDETIAAGTIDPKFVPNTRTTVRVLALTDWDSSLKADADTVHGHAVDLLKALEDGDVEAAKDPAHELHEGWHEFSDEAWAVVAKDLPPDAGGVAPDEDEEETTPAAGTTPAAH